MQGMTGPDAVAVAAAGLAAGAINTIVGSGSLITFPTLLAVGYPAVLALLLIAPGAFRDVVPILILVAVALVLIGPYVSRRRAEAGRIAEHPGPLLHSGVFLTSIYGGYFGAAQGVIFLALLGLTLDDDLQRLNGVKNVIAAIVNGVAAVYFMAAHDVAWVAVLILVVASTIGGQLGALWGRRIPPNVLRIVIAVVGTGVAIKLLVD
jgi:uncharacterized membrane protein YfcA